MNACLAEMNLDKSLLDDIDAAFKNPALKCFPKCMYEKGGLIENGVIQRQKIMGMAIEMGPDVVSINYNILAFLLHALIFII